MLSVCMLCVGVVCVYVCRCSKFAGVLCVCVCTAGAVYAFVCVCACEWLCVCLYMYR